MFGSFRQKQQFGLEDEAHFVMNSYAEYSRQHIKHFTIQRILADATSLS